jgi:hypothetical protein
MQNFFTVWGLFFIPAFGCAVYYQPITLAERRFSSRIAKFIISGIVLIPFLGASGVIFLQFFLQLESAWVLVIRVLGAVVVFIASGVYFQVGHRPVFTRKKKTRF